MPKPKDKYHKSAAKAVKTKAERQNAPKVLETSDVMKRALLRARAKAQELNADSSTSPNEYAEQQTETGVADVALDTERVIEGNGKRLARKAREQLKAKRQDREGQNHAYQQSETERPGEVNKPIEESGAEGNTPEAVGETPTVKESSPVSSAKQIGTEPVEAGTGGKATPHFRRSNDRSTVHPRQQPEQLPNEPLKQDLKRERWNEYRQKRQSEASRTKVSGIADTAPAPQEVNTPKACDVPEEKPLIRQRGEKRVKEREKHQIRLKAQESASPQIRSGGDISELHEPGMVQDAPDLMLSEKSGVSAETELRREPTLRERMVESAKGNAERRLKTASTRPEWTGTVQKQTSGQAFTQPNAPTEPAQGISRAPARKAGAVIDGAHVQTVEQSGSTQGRRKYTQIKAKTESRSAKSASKGIKGSGAREMRFERYGRPSRMQTTLRRQRHEAEKSKQAVQKAKVAAEKAAKAARDAAKAVANTTKRAIEAIKGLITLAASGGWVVALAVILLCLIALIVVSPFGIFFAGSDSEVASVPVSVAVARVNYDSGAYLIELQDGDYSSITLNGDTADWVDVIAVFAVKTTQDEDDPMIVATLDEVCVDKLKEVFWDMNEVTSSVERTDHPDSDPDDGVDDSWTESKLTITITAKTAEDMKDEYSFNDKKKMLLDELLQSRDSLEALVGETAMISVDALDVLRRLPADLDPERRKVIQTACSLVGKINYFWGGKSLVIGWDSRWGTLKQVTAEGSSTTGRYLPYGMDCSGFVDWVFFNASGGHYIIGRGGGATMQHENCRNISWDDTLPGDLVFYPGNSHVGIVAGRDDDGNLRIIHCAFSYDGTVVNGK